MKTLLELQKKLENIKSKLDKVEHLVKTSEKEKEERKINWICDNH